jgi:Rab GDP dissociation inhibitor
VLRYLEFKQIAGSFVYRDGRISKVPSTEMEAVRSSLMGIFEKRRAKKFFEFIQGWKDDDPVTHQGQSKCRLGRASDPCGGLMYLC